MARSNSGAPGWSAAASADIAARLDRLPSSRTVWTIVLFISLGGVFEFYDVFFTAYVGPGMVDSGLFTAQSLGFSQGSRRFGWRASGTFVFSTFAGLVVRRGGAGPGGRPLRPQGGVHLVADLVCHVHRDHGLPAQTGQWLNVWRLVAGVGFGVQLVTIDTYIAELMPRALRGRAFSINQFVCFCIVPVVALLAWLMLPLKPFGVDGWRWVVLFGSVGAVAVWGLRAGIPESPRWLGCPRPNRGSGRHRQRHRSQGGSRVRRYLAPGSTELPPSPAGGRSFAEIFCRQVSRRTIMLSIFNAAQVIGFYGFNSWVPTLLIARGINITHGLEYAFIIAISQPIGAAARQLLRRQNRAQDPDHRRPRRHGAADGGLRLRSGPCDAHSDRRRLHPFRQHHVLCLSWLSGGTLPHPHPLARGRLRLLLEPHGRRLSGLIVGSLLATGGVPAVAAFIGAAMLVGIAMIGIFGPSTNGLALGAIEHITSLRGYRPRLVGCFGPLDECSDHCAQHQTDHTHCLSHPHLDGWLETEVRL
jgi:putative MFS transporter